MINRSVWKRVVRTTTILAVGGSAFQLSGCDPAVRNTLLTGLQSTSTGLATALITAFFQTLADDPADTGGDATTTN